MTRGNGAVTSYAYDNVSRLTSVAQDLATSGADVTFAMTYNPASQIATRSGAHGGYAWQGHYAVNRNYTANGLNQYTAAGGVTPTYDSRGNLTSAGSITYGYDSANMLVSATGSVQLGYDPLRRLAWTTGNPNFTHFAYDNEALIAEYDYSGNLVRRYVHGPGVDEPLVWYEGTGTSDRRWFHADERGSVVAASNGSGTPIGYNSYDEYGIPASGNGWRFQYTGQQWIAELGMYHYRARMYSPTLGRFLQTDPIGFAGGMNLYAYVLNDPINLSDPSGLTGDEEIVVTAERWPRWRPQNSPGIRFGAPASSPTRYEEPEPDLMVRRRRSGEPECDAPDPATGNYPPECEIVVPGSRVAPVSPQQQPLLSMSIRFPSARRRDFCGGGGPNLASRSIVRDRHFRCVWTARLLLCARLVG